MIHRRGATALAAAVAAGDLAATDVVESHLERAEASGLNAFISIDAEGAMRRAGAVDRAVRDGREPGALAGVPVAMKDLIDQAGLVTTAGSSFYRDVPGRSATVVDRLEDAGAVVVGRTNLHEFAFGFSSENHWFGPCRNPWDGDTSTGGSSGGSAAATSAGLATVAVGTDTGGSVRGPAALCGVVGLKVTHGRIPLTGVFPLAPSLDTVGPITRSVGDAAAMYRVLAGDDDDPWSVDEPVTVPRGAPDLAGLRVAVPGRWLSDAPVAGNVTVAFRGTLDRLADLGVVIAEIEAAELYPAEPLGASVGAEVAVVHRAFRKDPRNRYGPNVEERLRIAEGIGLDDYVNALGWRARVRRAARRVFASHDLIVTPATGVTRKVIGVDDVAVDGGSVHYRVALSWFVSLVNHAGLPALALPLRVAGSPPPAIQLVAPWWHEERLLGAGLALEDAGVAGVTAPPGI